MNSRSVNASTNGSEGEQPSSEELLLERIFSGTGGSASEMKIEGLDVDEGCEVGFILHKFLKEMSDEGFTLMKAKCVRHGMNLSRKRCQPDHMDRP